MPVDIEHQTRRSGPGWVMWISPTKLTIITDDNDEDAGNRALEDLRSWGDPTKWTLHSSGWNDDNSTYLIFDWDDGKLPVFD